MSASVEYEDYLNPAYEAERLDRYVVRRAILDALTTVLPQLHGTLLDVGCGHMPYKSLITKNPSRVQTYIGLDLIHTGYTRRDVVWDGKTIPLKNESVNCAVATEVFEHCANAEETMREIRRTLKPGGLLFFTVPFLWPLHDVPYDEYRYTPFALQRLLRNAGYVNVQLKALGGWDASLAQLIGLWVRRRPMTIHKRNALSLCVLPIIRMLLKRDTPPQTFDESCMITGVFGTAYRAV